MAPITPKRPPRCNSSGAASINGASPTAGAAAAAQHPWSQHMSSSHDEPPDLPRRFSEPFAPGTAGPGASRGGYDSLAALANAGGKRQSTCAAFAAPVGSRVGACGPASPGAATSRGGWGGSGGAATTSPTRRPLFPGAVGGGPTTAAASPSSRPASVSAAGAPASPDLTIKGIRASSSSGGSGAAAAPLPSAPGSPQLLC